ncbi:TetR/AcrR family transcriptional regulator [Streptomyces sp. NPDC051907]|uniref:TetR/AcrR family transcriptional regulator n=1 Tax=Streptomyces sp. NPDC051907 TaxID=3155284 RepID=UPI00342B49BF
MTDRTADRMSDPRAERTRAKLRQALLAECEERPFEEVSVAALVRRAGVGRATFYLHYADLRALAVDACATVVRDAVEALHAWRGTPTPANVPPALTDFFASLPAHAGLYRTLLHEGGSGPLGDLLHQRLRTRSHHERALAGAPAPELIASAVASTFAGVLADWLHARIPATPEEIATQTWRLLLALHGTRLS